jgi:hypothetical protein
MTEAKKVKYEVLVGLDYQVEEQNRRVEPGEVVDDIPAESVEWLKKGGYIQVVRPKRKKSGGEG